MPRALKSYNPQVGGVLLDADFKSHAANCEACQRFYTAKPETTALLCLEGSVLWKRENVEVKPRDLIPANHNRVSKAKLKQIMRYKE